MGLEEAPRRLEETLRMSLTDEGVADDIAGMMEVILNATRDEHSGRLCEWYVPLR
jgi:hypothetical protein